jgi:hypothetical protein
MKANVLRVKWSGRKEWRYDGDIGTLLTRGDGPHTVERGGRQHWGQASVQKVKDLNSVRNYVMDYFFDGT